MPELGPYGSVRGARGNSRPYRDLCATIANRWFLTHTEPRGTTQARSDRLKIMVQYGEYFVERQVNVDWPSHRRGVR